MKIIRLLLFFIFLHTTVFAQNYFGPYSITNLSQDDGLSQGSNYFRFEDSKGFMWITAADAVNRYDGSHVKVYNLNKYFKNCPNLQQGYGFAEDAEANIYIGSDKGLYTYNYNTDKFTLQKIFTTPDNIAMPFAFRDNKIWCFNRFYQLASYNVNTKETKIETNISLDTLKSIHIYQNSENVFYYRFPIMDKLGNIWIVGKHKIAVYNIYKKNTLYPIDIKVNNKDNTFFSSTFDELNNILYIGSGNGIIQYFIKTGSIKKIEEIDKKKLDFVYQITNTNNTIVFNSTGAGVGIIDKDFNKINWLKLNNTTRTLNHFTFDKGGRLWTTDDARGQKVFNFTKKLFKKIPNENSNNPFLFWPSVSTIAELPNKHILFQSFWALNKKNDSIYPLRRKRFYTQFYRSSADTFRNGTWHYAPVLNILVGKFETDIIFRDSTGNFKPFYNLSTHQKIIQQQDFLPININQILISASNGLFWFNDKENKIIVANNTANAFKINTLSNNRVAVSYLGNDLILYQLSNNSILTEVEHILPTIQSFYIQENIKTKQYWVGTNKGIYLLDENFNEIKHFDANNGLAGTYIYGLLLDDDGNAWCSHQHGLSSIHANGYNIINYDKNDGIQDWDFNNRAFLKGSDGTLYFGGINGVNYFKPPLHTNTFYKPEVYVDEILINNNPYLPDTSANQLQTISVGYSENNISLAVYIKDLENAANQKIIYRIKEQTITWNYLANKDVINFTSLAPGRYTLELGIFDKFSNKEIIQKVITIEIASPFYKKTWFWLLIGMVSSGLFFWLLNRRKFNKQKSIFQQQQALQNQRQKITADLHDDIGSSLSSLQVNSSVASILIDKDVEKTKQLLTKIENQSKNIAENIGDFIWSMKPGKEEFITLSGRIKNFANDILGSSNIAYEIEIDKEIDSLITDITMRKNILFIAKEAINNAVKYSQASFLKIQLIKKDSTTILFSVKDNGVGFTPTTISGNGISNMQRRVEELKGIFTLLSNNNGTEVKFEMPIG
jgi:signal transduction histidine kinase/ligand-binding sensor domain-containing protein